LQHRIEQLQQQIQLQQRILQLQQQFESIE
jgi:hypothetical protein